MADRLAGKNMLTPRKLRNWIRGRMHVRYSLCNVRRILLFLGFSSKRSVILYVSAAGADTVRQWQADAAGTISGAKRRGFTIVVQDESIFLRTGTNGRKLWSRVGDPVTVCRSGRRDRTVVFGAPAEDGTRLMRQYERFDGPTFARYLREVRRKWGRVLLVTDNASQHKRREVKKYLEEHDGMEILCLPTATPRLSAVESVWKDAKYRLATSEHHETLEDLTHAVSKYSRTCPIRLDIYKFLYHCVWGEIFNEWHSRCRDVHPKSLESAQKFVNVLLRIASQFDIAPSTVISAATLRLLEPSSAAPNLWPGIRPTHIIEMYPICVVSACTTENPVCLTPVYHIRYV